MYWGRVQEKAVRLSPSSLSERSLMSMIRKKSHPNSNLTKKEKASSQQQSGIVYFK